MKALVTRPHQDAQALSQALQTRGIAVTIEPMLDITLRHGVSLPEEGLQGFVATSANGVRALAANDTRRHLPLWAVGRATARVAREMGFTAVESADGDVDSLAALIVRRTDPAKGTLLHVAGSALAGDLGGRLAAAGFEVRREVLYEAEAARVLSPALLAAIDAESLSMALFFSPRTAATFVKLLIAAGRQGGCRSISAFALSQAVADRLALLSWGAIHCAAHPDQAALLAAIDAALADDGAGPGNTGQR